MLMDNKTSPTLNIFYCSYDFNKLHLINFCWLLYKKEILKFPILEMDKLMIVLLGDRFLISFPTYWIIKMFKVLIILFRTYILYKVYS